MIANSYGSYLVVLALLDAPTLDTSVMLLSPVLGKAVIGGSIIAPQAARASQRLWRARSRSPRGWSSTLARLIPITRRRPGGSLGLLSSPTGRRPLLGRAIA